MTDMAIKEDKEMDWEQFLFCSFLINGFGIFQESEDLNLAPGNMSTHN